MKTNVCDGKLDKLNKDRVCLGVYVSADMHKELTKVARSKEITISVIVRTAIKQYLKDIAV